MGWELPELRPFRWVDETFAAVYGFDVTSWPGYPVLSVMHKLIMVTWLSQNIAESPDVAAEVHKRIGDLRRGDGRRDWAPL